MYFIAVFLATLSAVFSAIWTVDFLATVLVASLTTFFAALPEGVGFSILIANMVAVVLDHYEWSNPRYTWKKFLAMGLLFVIPALVVFLATYYGGFYYAS